MPEEPIPARPGALTYTETPEERRERLDADYCRLENAFAPAVHRDLCLNAADNQFALAKTDALLGGLNAVTIGAVIGSAGGALLILPAAFAAVGIGSFIHHFNKGIALTKEAGTCIYDPVLEGRLAEEPALSRT